MHNPIACSIMLQATLAAPGANLSLTADKCQCRRLGPVVRYVSNVMLPDGLFGPIIGFVIRLKYFK